MLLTVYNLEFGDDWPLGQDRIRQLDVNEEHLINIIDPCNFGLIGILLAAHVINERQYRIIYQQKNSIRKNGALLSIIRRQSVKNYNNTIACLIQSNQRHIAEVLQMGG